MLTLLAGAGAATAGEPLIDIEAVPAFGLKSVWPGWIPIRVAARNRAPAGAEGAPDRFVFKLHARTGGGEGASAVREETIAPGATKRFWLYGYAATEQMSLALSAEVAGSGAPAIPRPIAFAGRFSIEDPGQHAHIASQKFPFRIAVVSRTNPGALSILRSLSLPNFIDAEPVPIEESGERLDLPDRRVGYAPLDLVVLNDVDLNRLTPEQTEALRSWTFGGGRLLLSPGLDRSWLRHAFFEDLVPPVMRDLSAPYEVRRWRAGFGEVALLAEDISAPRVRAMSEDERQRFWNEVFRRYLPREGRARGERWPVATPRAHVPEAHALLVPSLGTPVLAIAIFALVYVAAIGPINFAVLRRLGREPLLVVTVPGIALAAVLGVFAAGTLWQGASARAFEVTILRARPGERFALAERWVAVVPPRQTEVSLRCGRGEEAIALSTERDDAAARGYRIEERERSGAPAAGMVVGGLAVARWQPGIFRAESVRELDGEVRVEAAGSTASPPDRVEVANGTRRTLRRVAARSGKQEYAGGPIAPGATGALSPVRDLRVERGGLASGLELRAWAHAIGHELATPGSKGSKSSERVVLVALVDPEPEPEDAHPKAAERAALLVVEP